MTCHVGIAIGAVVSSVVEANVSVLQTTLDYLRENK